MGPNSLAALRTQPARPDKDCSPFQAKPKPSLLLQSPCIHTSPPHATTLILAQCQRLSASCRSQWRRRTRRTQSLQPPQPSHQLQTRRLFSMGLKGTRPLKLWLCFRLITSKDLCWVILFPFPLNYVLKVESIKIVFMFSFYYFKASVLGYSVSFSFNYILKEESLKIMLFVPSST